MTSRLAPWSWTPALWTLLLLVAFGLRLPVLFAPLEHLVTVLPDDAFYYFETARNIASGAGSTFDGQDLADGYQPLWLALLVPFAWLPKLVFVKTALALGIVFHLVALAALGRFVFLITGHHVAALATPLIYTCNRWAMLQSVNGLETALTSALFCVCLVMVTELHRVAGAERHSWRWAARVGVVVALLFLARTDQIFYCAGFLLATLFLVEQRSRWVWRVGVAGLLVAGPWVLGHLLWTGNLLPSSGGAQPLILHTLAELNNPAVDPGWVSLRGFFTGGIFGYTGHDRRILVPCLAVAGVLTLIRYRSWSSAQRRALGLLTLLGIGAVALAFVHTYIRWYPRTWYFDQYIIITAAFLGLAIGLALDLRSQLIERFPSATTAIQAAALSCALIFSIPVVLAAHSGLERLTNGNYSIQARTLLAAQWLDAVTPNDAVIGSFNSGILAFALDQPVVGLDGAISATSLPYLERRDLTRLICERGVDYVADHASEFDRYRPFLPGFAAYAVEPARVLPHDEDQPRFLAQPVSQGAFGSDCTVSAVTPN